VREKELFFAAVAAAAVRDEDIIIAVMCSQREREKESKLFNALTCFDNNWNCQEIAWRLPRTV
jgi:hypothetical protein